MLSDEHEHDIGDGVTVSHRGDTLRLKGGVGGSYIALGDKAVAKLLRYLALRDLPSDIRAAMLNYLPPI